jgi:hypothetical protein
MYRSKTDEAEDVTANGNTSAVSRARGMVPRFASIVKHHTKNKVQKAKTVDLTLILDIHLSKLP